MQDLSLEKFTQLAGLSSPMDSETFEGFVDFASSGSLISLPNQNSITCSISMDCSLRV